MLLRYECGEEFYKFLGLHLYLAYQLIIGENKSVRLAKIRENRNFSFLWHNVRRRDAENPGSQFFLEKRPELEQEKHHLFDGKIIQNQNLEL